MCKCGLGVVSQLAASKAELGELRTAKAALAQQLEALGAENKRLLQRSALADSLAAEADALRQQVGIFSNLGSIAI